MSYPKNYRYTKDHEWIEGSGETVKIGLTEYAQNELGDIVFVELPEVDSEFEAGEAFGVVESVKAVSDCYMPVSGKIVEVNEALEDNPALVNQSAQEEGWIIKIAPAKADDVTALMDAAAYEEFLKENQ